ncbi:glycoside hydrolase [Dactylonectria macrodidyma]|uniref:alpha-1,2-Mannosidase n=1 Tax=Dactylonectria macrodidyma TaxID=307937 RepID=A0A9P9F8I0_9HYPO|nr:glycoside hydrolase [Dactylonectria macrodidyma]
MAVGLPFNASRVLLGVIIAVILLVGYFTNVSHPLFSHDSSPIEFVASSYSWANHTRKHPVAGKDMAKLPTGKPAKLPSIQHQYFTPPKTDEGVKDLEEKRKDIKHAFAQSWAAYEKHAWGHDELKPLSLGSHDSLSGWGASIIDALDTLWLMDMKSEFRRAARHVARINWSNSTTEACNLVETNVRFLGGLLSAYELSSEGVLLSKAIEVGDLLYAAFDNYEHMPPQDITFQDLKLGRGHPETKQSTAALGSMSLEFTRLSQLTGDTKYYDAINRITLAFDKTQNTTFIHGLWPTEIDVLHNFDVTISSTFSIGADSGSIYEYLLKQFVLLRGQAPVYEKMYTDALDAILDNLLFRPMLPKKEDVLMIGKAEVANDGVISLRPHLEHQSCFAGGMIAMGGKLFKRDEHVVLGDKLTRGCAYAYSAFPHGVMPEISTLTACPSLDPCEFRTTSIRATPDGFNTKDKRYALRPEAIESVFILYRITGNDEYRTMAWDMWQAVKKATKTPKSTFAEVSDVTLGEVTHADSMESFWLSGTLKYFYLMFSDAKDVLNLDDWVFNTEGHPLKWK